MPVHYTIQANLIAFKLNGNYSIDELKEVCYKAILNPAFQSPMKVIVDLSQAPSSSTSKQIKEQAAVLRSINAHLSSRWAILAEPGPLNYGLARMFAAHIGRDDIQMCIFADHGKACRWLFEADSPDQSSKSCGFPPLSEFKDWQPYT